MERSLEEVFRPIASTGRWWDPPFWREADFQAQTAWPSDVLDSAFTALQKLYGERETIDALAWTHARSHEEAEQLKEHAVWRVLCARWPLSGLVRLGLDAVDGDLFRYSGLVRKLRSRNLHEYKGARFELRVLAALRSAGIDTVYEPFARSSGANPDFLLRLPEEFVVDAKHADEGADVREEQSWLSQLAMYDALTPYVSAEVRLTDRFHELQQTDDGRSLIRERIKWLAGELARTKLELAISGGPFPVVATIEGLIWIRVAGPPGTSNVGLVQGVQTDEQKEASRVVRSAIAHGATQIPADRIGAVLVNAKMRADASLLVDEAKRWMDAEGEGANYPQLVGVLVLSEMFPEPVPGVTGRVAVLTPVWRCSTPSQIMNAPWQRLANAFARRDREALMKRCHGVATTRC